MEIIPTSPFSALLSFNGSASAPSEFDACTLHLSEHFFKNQHQPLTHCLRYQTVIVDKKINIPNYIYYLVLQCTYLIVFILLHVVQDAQIPFNNSRE